MTIRRKRRQRGKRKELRREALKTWARLTNTDQPKAPTEGFAGFPGSSSVIIPVIRRVMPSMIANELVGVQPMSLPIGDVTSGIEPLFNYRYNHDRTKKEIQEQRKKERRDKKFAKRVITETKPSMGEVSWDATNFTIRDD